MKTFDELLEFLNSIPKINQGGCGVSALVMYRWLKKHKKHPKIVFFYSWRNGNKSLNERAINDKKLKGHCCTHAVIRYKNKYYDSNGETNPSFSNSHSLPEDVVVRAINNIVEWNDDFDRKHIIEIQKKTGIDLSDIKITPRKFCKSI